MTDLRHSRPEDIPLLRQLWKDCFGDTDSFLDLFFSTAYVPERSLVLAEQEEILGAAYWFDCSVKDRKLAYVYAVAITPARQGQGLGSALMDGIHTALRRESYGGALLVPGEEGLRRYYQKFGYRTCSFRPGEVSLPPLSPVAPAEYARLRRELLPENGVLQEGENLAFLSHLADFYHGNGCIATLSREDGSCLELLGAAQEEGSVPYAMGRSLDENSLPDRLYFAFGFN